MHIDDSMTCDQDLFIIGVLLSSLFVGKASGKGFGIVQIGYDGELL